MPAVSQPDNASLVRAAMTAAFVDRDLSAFDRYWSPDYLQHSHLIPAGRDGLRDLVASLPSDFRYDLGMLVAEGDLVAVHGRYSGSPWSTPQIVADFFRIQDGLLVEHWDVWQSEVPASQSASGAAMFTNPHAGTST